MVGIKLSKDIQVNIGDKDTEAIKKINKLLETRKDLIGTIEEDDRNVCIKLQSPGPVVPYIEVQFIIEDEYVMYIEMFNREFTKLVIDDKEMSAPEAFGRYQSKYVHEVFCEELDRTLSVTEAKDICHRAERGACNITCPNCKKEKEHLYVEDDSKIISLVTLDDDNCKPIKKYDMAFINFGEEISNELGIAIK